MAHPLCRLGVNVDHVATLRQARHAIYPDPVTAAALAELGGAEQITIHLREDRRHIGDRDLELIRKTCKGILNLEMACTAEMVGIARERKPDLVTLVPERREELTTEGGLDVAGTRDVVAATVRALHEAGIEVSLFVDPDGAQLEASRAVKAERVELHTGSYCDARPGADRERELVRLVDASRIAKGLGFVVAAGHGLNYDNVLPVAAIPEIVELNIGHAIVARAVYVGLERAVRDMLELIRLARR